MDSEDCTVQSVGFIFCLLQPPSFPLFLSISFLPFVGSIGNPSLFYYSSLYAIVHNGQSAMKMIILLYSPVIFGNIRMNRRQEKERKGGWKGRNLGKNTAREDRIKKGTYKRDSIRTAKYQIFYCKRDENYFDCERRVCLFLSTIFRESPANL